MSEDRVTVFGGSGFLGREIVAALTAAGLPSRVAVRHPERVASGKEAAGLVETVRADVREESSVASAVAGSSAVVNAVGLYVESGAATFEAVHERGAGEIARQCAEHGVGRLVHVSGIGADPESRAGYIRARGRGEQRVKEAFPEAVIFRPSVMVGRGDAFFTALADIARYAPVLPLFGKGEMRLQPVHVGDVAAAARAAVQDPEARGKTFELGGPEIRTYRELVELLLARMGRRRLLLPVPLPAWELLARAALVLPSPPLTPAQIALMRSDNVADADAPSLKDLGVEATTLEAVLAEYDF